MRQMMLSFAGTELGPFSDEEVQRYFSEGYLFLSDKVRSVTENQWLELSQQFRASQLVPDIVKAQREVKTIPPKPKFEFPPETVQDEPDPLPAGWFDLNNIDTPKPSRG